VDALTYGYKTIVVDNLCAAVSCEYDADKAVADM
jgi:hypothetical protein